MQLIKIISNPLRIIKRQSGCNRKQSLIQLLIIIILLLLLLL